MSSGEEHETSVSVTDQAGDEPAAQGQEEKRKLELDVHIEDVGPCKKHLKVTVPRSEIEHQFQESLGTFQKDAHVPGFRPGHAPRQLVIKRFKKEVSGQVKSSILMATLEQIDRDYQLNPITQPKLDVDAIELPDDGPMSFEMEVEVRPDFPLPNYKDLKVKRPVKAIKDQDVESALSRFLERYAQVVPKLDGAAQIGDYLTADLKFHKPDGSPLSEVKESQFRLQPELRFQDGHIPGIGKALEGAKPGETREVQAQLGTSVADPELRGQSVKVDVVVHDLKQLRLPETNATFLASIGFDSLDELREAVRASLERRYDSQQRQAVRTQVMDALIAATPFDLPSDLVSRQERSTAARLVSELRQGGFSDADIRAREAEIRANAHETTLRSLKEFFILAKIAEAESIQVEDEDVEMEIEALAARTDESPRRVRARLEKDGLGDSLATQILERKALDHILRSVEITDEAVDAPETDVETLDQTATPAAEGGEPAEQPAGQ
ncbi:Trigger factor [Aquisphaera giovannonii]|uniref:Trigger factor n=1 Tax=Aquisphaera giovannonii TaxID=406548 RepID=A0A5B9VYR1_9BACT|nr:trigger factor [Aquisphaera giovannonii]QEH32760.1 Trigger factor [Aquisphaera giovannonii]